MLADLTLDRLHAAYAGGTPVEAVMREVYAAIERVGDPGIFITLCAADDVIAAVRSLGPFDPAQMPLWGVPFAVKDNIDVAGLPTSAACPPEAYVPDVSAAAVSRLIEAGAIVIGKTNLDQFATGLVGVRTPYPAPRNAIDPALVPGGSSSGSAVAVARGLVTFGLGTDTAGSGRVPAALNNIVGLKPSLGAVPMTGVVPACRTLDCVSVFALTADDGWRVLEVMAGPDDGDPYSRPLALADPMLPPGLRVGVPAPASLEFFGDGRAEAAFATALADLAGLGHRPVAVDLTPFRKAADLLYEGPWIAERYQAIRHIVETRPEVLHPATRAVIESARKHSAADAFEGIYELRRLARRTETVWRGVDVLMVPTIPTIARIEEIEADPITPNARLGTYTNFVNLLDLAALAVPGRWRSDRRPAGVTLIGPRGSDGVLAALGARLHHRAGVTLGALSSRVPAPRIRRPAAPRGWAELVVVGAHMSGLALNHELARLGATFLREARTEASYALYALPGGPPSRPGLLRTGAGRGARIAVEVWALPEDAFGRFVASVPSPLSIGKVRLEDGSCLSGFLVESEGVTHARDISATGGWRSYLLETASG